MPRAKTFLEVCALILNVQVHPTRLYRDDAMGAMIRDGRTTTSQ
jgi:hypothetical protein